MMFALLALLAAAPPQAACVAVDGDTLRCGRERIRLLGIDAPELPGHCQEDRRCAPGNPYASTNSLRTAMRLGRIVIQRISVDRYGRTLALVRAGNTDLSCFQLTRGKAIYKPYWDDDGRLARICPAARE